MKKYLFVLSGEFLLSLYWLRFTQILFLFHILLYAYLFAFPVIYTIMALLDRKQNKNLKYYFFGFLPILITTAVTYIADGTAAAVSNPDSSIFNWFIFFNFIRAVVLLAGFMIIMMIRFINGLIGKSPVKNEIAEIEKMGK